MAKTSAAGALISRMRYEPYGNTAAGTNPNGPGFTGYVNDPDTGLVYMQQRYYDPLAGRFLSVDPVVTDANTGGHFGRFHYANNNPYRYIDVDGRAAGDAAKRMHDAQGWTTTYEAEADGGSQAPRPSVEPPSPAANAPGGEYIEPTWEEIGAVGDGIAQVASVLPVGGVLNIARGAAFAIPKVANGKLANIVSDLYKGAKGSNPIGTGSTADAIRNEAKTGIATGGRFHAQKGAEYIRALENWQVKNPNAAHYDRMVAESLKNDLRNALGK